MFTNRFGANGKNTPASADVQKPISSLEAVGGVSSDVYLIRDRVQRKLLSETEGQITTDQQPQMKQLIENLFNQVLAEENLLYTRTNRQRLLDWVMADILGYGPIEPLLNDPSITEVMAVGPKNIYI
jgi:pilus assembly protein CpaF